MSYKDIGLAPFQSGLYSVGDQRIEGVCYSGDIYESEGNGALAVYSDGMIKVGKVEGLKLGESIFISRPVWHFAVVSNGPAQIDYILRELRSDYVLNQAKAMERLFGEVERQDLRHLKIAVPSLDVQDEILQSEALMFDDLSQAFCVINTYFEEPDASESIETLNTIIDSAKNGKELDWMKYYTALRIIFETVLRTANKYGILHDNCLPNGTLNVAEAINFMSGFKTTKLSSNVKCKKRIFPKLLTRNALLIWKATSENSHASLARKEYREFIYTPFLLYSITYLLFDVIIWFGKYVELHPDAEANRRLWIDSI